MRREAFTLNIFRMLYCAQGTADRFVDALILGQMYSGEISYRTGAIGFCIKYLPWIVKPLLGGPLVDGLRARRDIILILANVSMAISIAIFPLFSPTGSAILWLAVISGLLSGLQDVATDGIAFQYFNGSEAQHRVEKGMQQGTAIGNLVGGAGMLALQPFLTWFQVCGLVAAWIAATGVLPAAMVSVTENGHVQERRAASLLPELKLAMSSNVFWLGCGIAIVSFSGTGFLDAGVYGKWLATQRPAGTAQEIKDAAKAALSMLYIVADLARLVGAPFADFLARRASGKQVSSIFVVIPLAMSYGAFAYTEDSWHMPVVMALLVAVSTFFEAVWRIHCFALLRGLALTEAKATEFAVFMTVRNLSKFWAGLVAITVIQDTPVASLCIWAGFLQILVLVPLEICRRRYR